VITIWIIYFLAAAVASIVFLFAGWQSKQAPGFSPLRDGHLQPAEIDLSETNLQADAGAALRLALKRLSPLMANLSVQADIAASFGLMVRMRGAALVELLEEMLTVVVHAAPVSRILVTAAADGANISISMSDDIPNADQEVRRASVRGLMKRVAMRGGALDVDVQPGEGTTMTLRLSCEDREDRASLEPMNGAMLSFSPSIRA
jgi:signal transduction histidine kinase